MKYRIDLVQTVTEGATVYVEADTEEDAEHAVLDMLEEATTIGGPSKIEWKFVDVEQDAEIIGIEEHPPVQDRGPPEGYPAGTLNTEHPVVKAARDANG